MIIELKFYRIIITDNALNDISRSTAVNERSVISNSADENNVRNAEDIIIQYNELNTISVKTRLIIMRYGNKERP